MIRGFITVLIENFNTDIKSIIAFQCLLHFFLLKLIVICYYIVEGVGLSTRLIYNINYMKWTTFQFYSLKTVFPDLLT